MKEKPDGKMSHTRVVLSDVDEKYRFPVPSTNFIGSGLEA